MEDSLELPDDYEEINVNSLLSPEPQPRRSPNHTPPHSLAYSHSTQAKQKYLEGYVKSPHPFEGPLSNRERSPNVGVIAHNREKARLQGKSEHVTPLKSEAENDRGSANVAVADRRMYRKVNPRPKVIMNSPQQNTRRSSPVKSKSPQREREERGNDRKTIDKGEMAKLRRKIKELEEALHVETVVSEELRTKNAISNQLLESKMKEKGFEFVLGLKNTSRDKKSIDIFVEMTALQRQLTEKNLMLERNRQRMSEMELEISQLRSRKGSPTRSRLGELTDSLEQLLEEKESLMGYIEEQKATMRRKVEYIGQLEREIGRMGEKEEHYTHTERPALLTELAQAKKEIQRINEEHEKTKMENGLLSLTLEQNKGNFAGQVEQLEAQLRGSKAELQAWNHDYGGLKGRTYQGYGVQVTDEHRPLLLKELELLKNQRDHYYEEYRRGRSESAALYARQVRQAAMGDE